MMGRWLPVSIALAVVTLGSVGCRSEGSTAADPPTTKATTTSTVVDDWLPDAVDAMEATKDALGSIVSGARDNEGLSCELALNHIARAEDLIEDVPDRLIRTTVVDTLRTFKTAAQECAPYGYLSVSTLKALKAASEGLDPAARRLIVLAR